MRSIATVVASLYIQTLFQAIALPTTAPSAVSVQARIVAPLAMPDGAPPRPCSQFRLAETDEVRPSSTTGVAAPPGG
jgi:hypothetical protein